MSGQHWDEPRPAIDAEPLEFSEIPDDYIRVWDHILNAYSHEDFKTLMYLDYVMRGRLKTYARSKAERVRLGKLRNASKPPFDQDAD